MALPKIELPIYDFTVPSTKKVIQYRPFTVKEKKILLMALEGGTESEIYNSIKHIISNCIITENVDVDEFSTFDLELFFLTLRARSISEVSQITYGCKLDVDGHPCGGVMETEIKLLEVELSGPMPDKTIKFTDKVGIVMKYPTLKGVISEGAIGVDNAFNYIAGCIDYIYDGEDITYAKDTSKEELVEFIESLSESNFNKISKFISDIPTIKKELKLTCPKCKAEHDVKLEGLQSFFA